VAWAAMRLVTAYTVTVRQAGAQGLESAGDPQLLDGVGKVQAATVATCRRRISSCAMVAVLGLSPRPDGYSRNAANKAIPNG
jgi:hypothetical protein